MYIYNYIYTYMSGGQNYVLLVMDMAKVGGPLSVVKFCTSMVCIKIGYRFLHKFEHPMSTPHYFSLLLILSVTHIEKAKGRSWGGA